jgi:hypothetical protein
MWGMMPEQERLVTAREEARRKVSFQVCAPAWRAFLPTCPPDDPEPSARAGDSELGRKAL